MLFALCTMAFSQEKSFNKPHGMAYGVDITGGYNSVGGMLITGSASYRFLPQFEIGVGTGVNIPFSFSMSKVSIPVFAHLGSSLLPNKSISPYLSANVGYNLPTKKEGGYTISGFMVEPAAGISFNVASTMRMYIAFAYHYDTKKWDESTKGNPLYCAKLGVSF